MHERITIITRIQEDIFDHISEERLPVGGLITSLAGYLELNCSDRRIRFKVQAEPLVCRSCGLVPFGLLLYEMVSNTVRHAFPENRKGADSSDPEIEIAFFRKSDDSIVLSVSDNGCGFPFQGDPLERKSLGMSMIKALAEQLDGTVELKGTEGVSWTVTFPCSELNVTVF